MVVSCGQWVVASGGGVVAMKMTTKNEVVGGCGATTGAVVLADGGCVTIGGW